MAPPPQQQQQQQQQRQPQQNGGGGAAFAARALKSPPPPPLVALITGCAPGGIGHALARALASRPGFRVIATARRKDQLKTLADLPGVEACLDLDVCSNKSVEACRKSVDRLTAGRGVDVLVNNAGVNVKGTVLDTDMAALERCMQVNVTGTLAVTKAFAPGMAARRRGLVVNVGSAAGYTYGPVEAVYAASKSAVRTLTDGLRVELAPLGVKVMLAAPGFVKTRIDDGPGRAASGGGGGGNGNGAAGGGVWFPPPPAPSSSSSADGFSPYALYGWMSRVVRSSIFELGPGVVHDSPDAFAERLADAIAREAPRAARPAPLAHRARQAAAAAAAKAKAKPGAPSQAAAAALPLPPPSALDMLAEGWRWWAPHCLGGPLRHFRAAPFAVVTFLVGALVPLWASDLVLGLYMGLWTVI